MDTVKLIDLISERKYLWDTRETNYHTRNVHKILWNEVAREMNIPVDDLKKRWRGLRDTYRREYKKARGWSGDGAAESKWPYFKMLSFLNYAFSSINASTNISTTSEYELETENADTVEDSKMSIGENNSDTPDAYTYTENESQYADYSDSLASKKKRKNDSSDENLMVLEEQKLLVYGQYTQDSDYHFLMSLLPFMKDLPHSRKLVVRTKLQQVLIEEFESVEN